ncbi:MAG: nuclear transport factor 2 family protein [Xanthobacteraceae bacterium]
MVARDDVEKLVREAYRRRLADDIAGTCEMFSQDADFRVAGGTAPGVPALAAKGQVQLRELLSQIVKTFVISDFKFKSIQVEGNRATVHWHAHMRSTVNGQEADTEIVDLLEFRDGRIASFLEFCDTAMAHRMLAG